MVICNEVYVSKVMPFDAQETLKEDEYWSILAFLLNSNGVLPPDALVGRENAERISLTP